MVRRPNYRMERADRARKQAERAAKKAAARAAKGKPIDDGTVENPAEPSAEATPRADE